MILWAIVLYEFLYIFYIGALSDIWFEFFPPFGRLSFHFDCLFCCIADFQFDVVSGVYFFLCGLCFQYHSIKIIPNTRVKEVIPCVCSKIFTVSSLMFKSLIDYELIFVYGVKFCFCYDLCYHLPSDNFRISFFFFF